MYIPILLYLKFNINLKIHILKLQNYLTISLLQHLLIIMIIS